jgi:hypothetical protein
MNTLPRAITARFFSQPEDYQTLKAHWKALHHSEQRQELTAAHHLLYLALLGKDWRKAFTPLTNQRKLENGAFGGWGLFQALSILHSHRAEEALLAPFAGLVTPAMLQLIRELVPALSPYRYQPQDFNGSGRVFPFDAYQTESLTSTQTGRGKVNA